tara:strand:- start:2267 stop:2530 length:264 start_codon:yes stop_codon:yes gene_type:complete
MKGKSESHYRFKVERLIEDMVVQGSEPIETLYFKQQIDLTAKLGIPKSTVYLMLKYGDNHRVSKWKNYYIKKCREPVYQKVEIEYIS